MKRNFTVINRQNSKFTLTNQKFKKKSQSFVTDFLVAIVIFVSSILFFFTLLDGGIEPKHLDLQNEAIFIAKSTSEQSSDILIVDNGQIDENNLLSLASADYDGIDGLKNKLGVIGDFSIHFEDSEGVIEPIGAFNAIGHQDIANCEGSGNLIKIHKIVNREGKPTRMVISTCG
tara:strand:- start:22604 stop:23125 length:522 start_codon:yes stop_codon:yes gene_type:complete